jgi:hypothetical protein
VVAADWTEGVVFAPSAQVWVFPDQGVVFTSLQIESPTPAHANAFIDMFHWLKSELGALPSPVIVHDWRAMRTIPRETREVFLARRREIQDAPTRVVVAVDLNPFVRMMIRTVSLGAQLVSRTVPIDFVRHPLLTLVELGVKTPDVALHARLRQSFARYR